MVGDAFYGFRLGCRVIGDEHGGRVFGGEDDKVCPFARHHDLACERVGIVEIVDAKSHLQVFVIDGESACRRVCVQIRAVTVEERHVRGARKSALHSGCRLVCQVKSVIFVVGMQKHNVFHNEYAAHALKIESVSPFFIRSDKKGFAQIIVDDKIVSVCAHKGRGR